MNGVTGVAGPIGSSCGTGPQGPPGQVKVWETGIPERPDAKVTLHFDHESGFIYCLASQPTGSATHIRGVSPPVNTSVIFSYNGDNYSVETKLDNGIRSWVDLATWPNPLVETVARRILAHTGTFCGNQASVDLQDPEIRNAPVWQQILDEARDLFSVCRVMMR